MAKNEPKEDKLPALLVMSYPATEKGWSDFAREARAADLVGYELLALTQIAKMRFGVVWKLGTHPMTENPRLVDDEDGEFPLVDLAGWGD